MKKSLASGVGVAAALMVVFGASANASPYDPYAGYTYADASSAISSAGGKAVIATRVGQYLPTEQCIVSGARYSNSKWLLDLNCNDTYAGKTGHAGNSAATAEGAQANKVMGWIEGWNKNGVSACLASAASTEWCLSQCDKYGNCSAETLDALQ